MPIFKPLYTFIFFTVLSFSATPEQVEHYLSVSNSEEELLALESQFSMIQNNTSSDNDTSKSSTYDMQMLSIRFKDYIQKHLSEDEMTEVLDNYKNVIFMQFISATSTQNNEQNSTEKYINDLQESAKVRIDLIKKISKKIYNKESMLVLFDEFIVPMMQSDNSNQSTMKELLKKTKKDYLKNIIESSKKELLYATKDFSTEELEEILRIAQTPAIEHESKVITTVIAYALKEFFLTKNNVFNNTNSLPVKTTQEKKIKLPQK